MPNIVVDDYTALLSGDSWNGVDVSGQPVIVTFSFPTTAPAYDSSAPGFTSTTVNSFATFSPDEQTQALGALGEWAAASGIVFLQVAPGQGDINFQNINLSTTSSYSGDAAGIGFYPFGDWTYASLPSFSGDLTASGDVFMNTADQAGDGTVNYGTLLHEIGHALGLKHPLGTDDDILGVDHDDVLSSDDPTRTIMATVGDPGDDHLKGLDKAAAAHLYGPSGTGGVYTASASGSNTVANWSWDDDTQTLTQNAVSIGETIHGTSVDDISNGSSGDDSLFGLAGNNQLYGGDGDDSLYDGPGQNLLVGGAGDDTYYVTNPNTVIVETPGGGDDTVYSTVSYTLSANIETLQLYGSGLTGTGNNQGDSIFGDVSGSTLIGGGGDDYLVGGAGDDTIEGGGGHDLMFGGGGVNTFVFKAASDATPGANLTTIGDFVSGQDKIDLSSIKTTGAHPGQPLTFVGSAPFSGVAGEVNEILVNGQTVLEGDLDGVESADFQIAFYNTSGGSPVSIQASDLSLANPCYRRGTLILTDRGEIPVEALSVGETVVTAGGAHRPIVWIGHRRLDLTRHPDPAAVWPVQVAAGAFGDALPRRDLWLSPRHAVAVEGALIPIVALINGASVRQVRTDAVEYWHVELDAHDVIFAESMPAESYLDNGNRTAFANGGAFVEAHPDFKPKHWRDTCLPLVEKGPQLERTRARLFARLEALGYSLCDDADPHGLADGRRIEPIVVSETRIGFLLPPGCRDLALASRTFAPAHVDPRSADTRELGVCLWRLSIDGDEVALDADALPGWHEAEGNAGAFTHRWTRGRVALPPGARFVIADFAGCGRYWREPANRLVAGSATWARD